MRTHSKSIDIEMNRDGKGIRPKLSPLAIGARLLVLVCAMYSAQTRTTMPDADVPGDLMVFGDSPSDQVSNYHCHNQGLRSVRLLLGNEIHRLEQTSAGTRKRYGKAEMTLHTGGDDVVAINNEGINLRHCFLLADNLEKVEFDLQQLDADGLVGEGSGRRSLDYEFCLPRSELLIARVRQIDPSLSIYEGSPGRIGCRDNEVLCVGNTHQVGWEKVLGRLAAEPAIRRIVRTFFE
jgi:hypothetical protein